jgi:hypothetical protein
MDHDDDRRQKEPEHHHLRPMDEDGPWSYHNDDYDPHTGPTVIKLLLLLAHRVGSNGKE